ncbi:anti-sigma factor family protein [Aeoliella sp.]|uniref:anti-sigma factor family protein n=1 Tax=Aeoliella sp. TaxID=2795800 RepID=UPI003CCBB118
MKCTDIQDQLSAFYDGELSDESHAAMTRHLAACESCAVEFAGFQEVTRAVNRMPQPKVPPAVWNGLAVELAAGESHDSAKPQPVSSQNQSRYWWSSSRQLALAASVLLMLGFGYWMSRGTDHSHFGDQAHSAEFVATMDHYLRQLPADPDAAEQFLLNKYDGQRVNADEAVHLVGYRPAVSKGLPDGYSLASTSVLKMPCCTCVKAVCKRQDGSTLVLFEHDDEKTEWFGDRPSNMAMCGDKECCLVDLDSSIAATWRRGSRSLTAVGVRDVEEVNTLVSWLDAKVGSAL